MAGRCRAAYVSLGSNLGDRRGHLLAALDRLAACGALTALSPLYRTAPVDYLDQPEFYNAVAAIATEWSPHALLERLLAIENELGRRRLVAKGPRVIDLDLLLHDSFVVDDEQLTLPHPRLQERRFVLTPLADIAPSLRCPRLGRSVAELLAALPAPEGDAVARLADATWESRRPKGPLRLP